MMNNYT